MKIYFAGPLFSSAEREFNQELTDKLEMSGFTVFLPQRDGVESNKFPYLQMSKDDRQKAIFSLDRDQVLESEIFLFILDGRVPDEGACVELGIAYAQNYLKKTRKLLIGFLTDSRAAFIGSKLNPMLKVPFDSIVSTENELFELLKSARQETL